MTQASQTTNGKVPLESQYVIQALQEENYLLREQNVTLRGTLFQTQARAQEQITALQTQIADLQRKIQQNQPQADMAEAVN